MTIKSTVLPEDMMNREIERERHMTQMIKAEKPEQTDESMAAALERVLVKGDLSKLTDDQRIFYVKAVCDSVGLNPLTRPFDFLIMAGGKLTLYANKSCTDQLRTIKGISIDKLETKTEEGIYEVRAYALNAAGRRDADLGAVSISGLRGETLANAKMKATTKAKRRVTLSICGLGMLDESEVDSVPGAQRAPASESLQAEALQDYISAAPAAQQPVPAAAQTVKASPPATKPQRKATQRDNILAIGELIKQLLAAGIDLKTIQARMQTLTGCDKREQLNAGQAIVLIEEFESWLDVLDQTAAEDEGWEVGDQ